MTSDDATVMRGPTRAIEEWWQDELNDSLVRRIAAASHTQLHEFGDFYDDWQRFTLPERPSGLLRPRVLQLSGHETDANLALGVSLLLYAHEVILDDPLRRALLQPNDRQDLTLGLQRVLALKDLDVAGLVHYEQSSRKFFSKSRHPSRAHNAQRRDWPQVESLLGKGSVPGLDAYLDTLRLPEDEAEEMIQETVRTILDTVNAVDIIEPTRWNPFARNTFEAAVLTAALGDAGSAQADRRQAALTKLASMGVPEMALSIADLVRVRESEEAFANWRESLQRALDQVELMPDTTSSWQKEAREVVAGELGPLVERLERATRRSPALSALGAGKKNFVLGGFGAISGAAITQDLMGGVVGAAVAAGLTMGDAYVRALRDRRVDRASLQLALIFTSEALP